MKNAILLILLILILKYPFYSQCTLSGLSSSYCINASSSSLTLNPAGGVLSGNGISNTMFSPSLAGIGTHTVNYSYCSTSYSLESPTFTQTVNIPTFITLSDNQMSPKISLGFTFRFFCKDYTDFYISSNGFITFDSTQTSGCCQGLTLPTTSAKNIIACAWTDLDPTQGGTIRYCLMGSAPNRAMLISFNCINHKTGLGPVTSEIWLFETSNNIEINTITKPIPTSTVQYNTTMGIQGNTLQAMVVPGRNGTSNWTATNELFRFIPGEDCSITQTVSVYANPTISVIASNSLICKGEPVTLQASGGSNYVWNTSQSGSSIVVLPEINTNYTVTGTDLSGCSGTSTVSVKVSGCSGTAEQELFQKALVHIYPNPSSHEFTISSFKKSQVSIYNEFGEWIRSLVLSEDNAYSAQIRGLIPGIYFIVCDSMEVKLVKKLVVID